MAEISPVKVTSLQLPFPKLEILRKASFMMKINSGLISLFYMPDSETLLKFINSVWCLAELRTVCSTTFHHKWSL